MKFKNTTLLLKIFFLFFLLGACSKESNQIHVKSPNEDYVISFEIDEKTAKPSYVVNFKNIEVITKSKLGFLSKTNEFQTGGIHIDSIAIQTVVSKWKPVYGEKSEYPEIYNEALIHLKNIKNQEVYSIRMRSYNEGVAFRYEFPENMENTYIKRELTQFSLPPLAKAWASIDSQTEIREMPVSEIKKASERPLLVQYSDTTYLAIGEAAQIDYARMKLVAFGNSGRLHVDLKEGQQREKVMVSASSVTPWRFIMAGKNAGEILEHNYLILNLNEPNKISDVSWLKPGKVIRDLTLTTDGGKAFIDFAVKHNIQYVIESAGWYGNEFTVEADARTATLDPSRSKGPLDMEEVIRYGNEKGIGIMVYVNRNQLEKQLDEILPIYEKWGLKGIKYGFVRTGDQKSTSWMHEAVRKAADHKMVLSIHDDYRPVGYSRTYPNLMTQEGIRGDEETPTNEHTLKTMFTRMIAGAADNTICYFAARVETMGSHASQLAKSVCIYSPLTWLYWYDRPLEATLKSGGAGGSKSVIQEVPELEFFDKVPTVWDETKVIHSQVGELGTIARKDGSSWFVGTINGNSDKMATIPLDFLDSGKNYVAIIYFDDPEVNTVTKVGIKRMEVNNTSRIQRLVKMNNGLAIHIYPKE